MKNKGTKLALYIFLFIITSNVFIPIMSLGNPVQLQQISQEPIVVNINTQKEWDVNQSIISYVSIIDTTLGEIVSGSISVSILDENENFLFTLPNEFISVENNIYKIEMPPLGIEGTFYISVTGVSNGRTTTSQQIIYTGKWEDSKTQADLEFLQLYNRATRLKDYSSGWNSTTLYQLRVLEAFKESVDAESTIQESYEKMQEKYLVFYINITGIKTTVANISKYYNDIKSSIKNLSIYNIEFEEYIINTTLELDSVLSDNWTIPTVNTSTNNAFIFNLHGNYFPIDSTLYTNITEVENYFNRLLIGMMVIKWNFAFFGEPFKYISFDNGTTYNFSDLFIDNGWDWFSKYAVLNQEPFKNITGGINLYSKLGMIDQYTNMIGVTLPAVISVENPIYVGITTAGSQFLIPAYSDDQLRCICGIVYSRFASIAFSTMNSSDDGLILSSILIGNVLSTFQKVIDTIQSKFSVISVNLEPYYPTVSDDLFEFINDFNDLWDTYNVTGVLEKLNETKNYVNNSVVPIYNATISQFIDMNDEMNGERINVSDMYNGIKELGKPYCFVTELVAGGAIAIGMFAGAAIASKFGTEGKIVGGVLAAIGIGILVATLFTFWSNLNTNIDNIWLTIKDRLDDVKEHLINTIQSTLFKVQEVLTAVGTKISQVVERVTTVVDGVGTEIGRIFDSLSNLGFSTVSQLYDNLTVSVSTIGQQINETTLRIQDKIATFQGDVGEMLGRTLPGIFGEINVVKRQLSTVQETFFEYMRSGLTDIQNSMNLLYREMSDISVDFTEILNFIYVSINESKNVAIDTVDVIGGWWQNTLSTISTKVGNVLGVVSGENDIYSRSTTLLPYIEHTFARTREVGTQALGVLDYALQSYGKISNLFYRTPLSAEPIEEGIMADSGYRITLTPTLIREEGQLRLFVALNGTPYDAENVSFFINSPTFSTELLAQKVGTGQYVIDVSSIDLGKYVFTIMIDGRTMTKGIDIVAYQPLDVVISIILIVLIIASGIVIIVVYYYLNKRKNKIGMIEGNNYLLRW